MEYFLLIETNTNSIYSCWVSYLGEYEIAKPTNTVHVVSVNVPCGEVWEMLSNCRERSEEIREPYHDTYWEKVLNFYRKLNSVNHTVKIDHYKQ